MQNEGEILGAFSKPTDGLSKSNPSLYLSYYASVTRITATSFFLTYKNANSPTSMPVTVMSNMTASMTVPTRQMLNIQPMMMSQGCMSGHTSNKNTTQMMTYLDGMGTAMVSVCPKGDSLCHLFKIMDVPPAMTLIQNFADTVASSGRKLLGYCCDGVCGKGVEVSQCCCSNTNGCIGCNACNGCPSCFPASALVDVQGKGASPMRELKYGDKVRSVVRSTGAIQYREVYLFGHRTPTVQRQFIELKMSGGQTLQLTSRHFIPRCLSGCDSYSTAKRENVYAMDIAAGNKLFVSGFDSEIQVSEVISVSEVSSVGVFNPFVFGADLIVDGVVASPHSDWILDSIVPGFAIKWLPLVYEILLSPIYLTYTALSPLLGPETARWMAEDLKLAEAGSSPLGYAAILAAPFLTLMLATRRP